MERLKKQLEEEKRNSSAGGVVYRGSLIQRAWQAIADMPDRSRSHEIQGSGDFVEPRLVRRHRSFLRSTEGI